MYKILLVEDIDLIRRDILEMIDWAACGYQITADVRNGEQGLSAYRKEPADIVITDIKMPIMDGLEMIRQIKRLNPHTQFILLTAYEEFDYAKQAMAMGIHSYLLKHELDQDVLLSALKQRQQSIEQQESYQFLNKSSKLRQHLNDGTALDSTCLPLYSWNGRTVLLLLENRDAQYPDSFSPFRLFLQKLRQSLSRESGTAYSLSDSLCLFLLKTAASGQKAAADGADALGRFLLAAKQSDSFHPFRYAISVSPAFFALHSLQKAYEFARMQLQEQVFFCQNCILTPKTIYRSQEKTLSWLELQIENIAGYLTRHKFFHAQKAVRSLFEEKLPVIQSVSLYQVALDHTVKTILTFSGQELPVDILRRLTAVNTLTMQSNIFAVSEELSQILAQLEQLFVPKYSKKVEEIILYLQNHYQENITLTDIAEHVGITPLYVSQLFKKEVGMNLMTYLTKCRIGEAKKLLKTGNYKVYEVSEMVGYQTVQYFSNCFKKETGKKPSEYGQVKAYPKGEL